MNEESQLKLQAYLDEELSAAEANEVKAWLAQDSEAQTLLNEFRNTAAALSNYEQEIKLPESRDFFWSKIKREIYRLDRASASEPSASPVSIFSLWRRVLAPVGIAGLLVVATILLTRHPTVPLISQAEKGITHAVETAMSDTGALTYRDQAEGMTVVWLSYPAENEFTKTDSVDTLQ